MKSLALDRKSLPLSLEPLIHGLKDSGFDTISEAWILLATYSIWSMSANVMFSICIKMDYYFDDNRIEPSCYLVNYSGVDIDSLLHFDNYIDIIVAKAYSRIGLLFRDIVSKKCARFKTSLYYLYQSNFRICIKGIVCSFNYAHKFIRQSSTTFQKANWTARFILSKTSYCAKFRNLTIWPLSCDLTLYYQVFHNPWAPCDYFTLFYLYIN